MHKLGLNKAVGYYCSKAGGRGRKLLEELSHVGGQATQMEGDNEVNVEIENVDGKVENESGKNEQASQLEAN